MSWLKVTIRGPKNSGAVLELEGWTACVGLVLLVALELTVAAIVGVGSYAALSMVLPLDWARSAAAVIVAAWLVPIVASVKASIG